MKQQKCDAELIYTDEAIFNGSDLYSIKFAYLKPDYSQELLETTNYFCHFCSFKKTLLEGLAFDSDCDGAQDFDMILKLTERTKKIFHIRKCLYYWRACETSTAASASAKFYTAEAGKRALEKHFKRTGEDAKVLHGEKPNQYKILYADKNKKSENAENCHVVRYEKIF